MPKLTLNYCAIVDVLQVEPKGGGRPKERP